MGKNFFKLFSKDRLLCIFSRKDEDKETLNIERIEQNNTHLLPFELRQKLTSENLSDWVFSRVTPIGRKLFKAAGGDPDDPLYKVEVTRLLSLNDAFWVDSADTDARWENINLYENDFSPELGAMIFSSSVKRGIEMRYRTPEIASSKGNLRKCWIIRNGKRVLLKADRETKMFPGRNQITSEWLACQVAKAFGIPHIDYGLEMFRHRNGRQELVCSCELFTSEQEGYIESHKIVDANPRKIAGQKAIAGALDFDAYADMMIFDALIGNGDRHMGNFGSMFDTNTGELSRMAPIFDNGLSLLAGCQDEEAEDFSLWDDNRSGAFISFELAIKTFFRPRHEEKLARMENFIFPDNEFIPCEMSERIGAFVRHRARYLLEQKQQNTHSFFEKASKEQD